MTRASRRAAGSGRGWGAASGSDADQAPADHAGGLGELLGAVLLQVVAVEVGLGPQAQHAAGDAHGLDLLEPLAADGGVVLAQVRVHVGPDLLLALGHRIEPPVAPPRPPG
jgi:hypothetical protein